MEKSNFGYGKIVQKHIYLHTVEQIDMLLTNLQNKIYEKPISFLIKQNKKTHVCQKNLHVLY